MISGRIDDVNVYVDSHFETKSISCTDTHYLFEPYIKQSN